ncbi:hypothetical protein ACE1TF_04955 [Geomicrobium sp. JSM 1781026]|uniref:hypothetical protein n=1 Tax=Geomicrobium sp. JSM 1781026 TaxID=3344580 RepID=UPI0035C05684
MKEPCSRPALLMMLSACAPKGETDTGHHMSGDDLNMNVQDVGLTQFINPATDPR